MDEMSALALPIIDLPSRRVRRKSLATKILTKEQRLQKHSTGVAPQSFVSNGNFMLNNSREQNTVEPSTEATDEPVDRLVRSGRPAFKMYLRPSISDTGIIVNRKEPNEGTMSTNHTDARSRNLNQPSEISAMQSAANNCTDDAYDLRATETGVDDNSPVNTVQTLCVQQTAFNKPLRVSPPVKISDIKHIPTPPVTPRQTINNDQSNNKVSARIRSNSLSNTENPHHPADITSDFSKYLLNNSDPPIVDQPRESSHHKTINTSLSNSVPSLTDSLTDISALSNLNNSTIHDSQLVKTNGTNNCPQSDQKSYFTIGSSCSNNISDTVSESTSIQLDNPVLRVVPAVARSNRLAPIESSPNLPTLSFEANSRVLRTTYKGDNVTTRDIVLERGDSTFDQKSADSFSVGSNYGLPVIFTDQVRNKGVNLNASCQSNNSLIGTDELTRYLPDRKLNIFVGSWNMCEIKSCSVSLDDFILPNTSRVLLDMYVIGTQENAMNKKEWEVLLQETLGLSHVLLYCASHQALHIAAFVRRDLMWFFSDLDWDCVSTRTITVVKTKGAVAISMRFFGSSLLFVNSHLTCSNHKTKHRMADYGKIIRELKLPKTSASSKDTVLTRFDCIFWCGDLNFRIERDRSNMDVMLGHLNTQDHPNFENLIANDQLYKCITEGRIFQDFQEGRITFSPTYKFDIGTSEYDTSAKMRIPSYTDRVLFRSRVKNSITCVCYDAVTEIKLSDHRPVYAQFQASIQPSTNGMQVVPEFKFDKAVYIEASRRLASHQRITQPHREKSSVVCTLM